jgi:hypothetical protein
LKQLVLAIEHRLEDLRRRGVDATRKWQLREAGVPPVEQSSPDRNLRCPADEHDDRRQGHQSEAGNLATSEGRQVTTENWIQTLEQPDEDVCSNADRRDYDQAGDEVTPESMQERSHSSDSWTRQVADTCEPEQASGLPDP